jgi:excinuclease UvrABC ATPase subunit
LQLSKLGGEIVAVGTPEDVAKSYTGQYLKGVLKRPRKEAAE